MPGVVEFLLLDRPWDRSANRVTFQDLEGWDLIDTYHPDPLFRKSSRIRIAPKDLLRPLLEPGVQPSRLPIPSPMGLQSDIMQKAANRCRADRRHDLVVHRLAGQIFAGPVGNVQPFGNRLQTGEFNDLSSLHRGNPLWTAQIVLTSVEE